VDTAPDANPIEQLRRLHAAIDDASEVADLRVIRKFLATTPACGVDRIPLLRQPTIWRRLPYA